MREFFTVFSPFFLNSTPHWAFSFTWRDDGIDTHSRRCSPVQWGPRVNPNSDGNKLVYEKFSSRKNVHHTPFCSFFNVAVKFPDRRRRTQAWVRARGGDESWSCWCVADVWVGKGVVLREMRRVRVCNKRERMPKRKKEKLSRMFTGFRDDFYVSVKLIFLFLSLSRFFFVGEKLSFSCVVVEKLNGANDTLYMSCLILLKISDSPLFLLWLFRDSSHFHQRTRQNIIIVHSRCFAIQSLGLILSLLHCIFAIRVREEDG